MSTLSERRPDPAWLRKALAPHAPDWRGPQSVRRHEADSPESLYLAELAAARAGRVLKDSRAIAERFAEAAARGVESTDDIERQRESARDMGMRA